VIRPRPLTICARRVGTPYGGRAALIEDEVARRRISGRAAASYDAAGRCARLVERTGDGFQIGPGRAGVESVDVAESDSTERAVDDVSGRQSSDDVAGFASNSASVERNLLTRPRGLGDGTMRRYRQAQGGGRDLLSLMKLVDEWGAVISTATTRQLGDVHKG